MPRSAKNITRSQLANFVSDEFYAEIRSVVIKKRAACRASEEKSTDWFLGLGAVAVEMAKVLPEDCSELAGLLVALRAVVRDVPSARPSSISKPFTELLDVVKEDDEIASEELLASFDKLRELIYRQEETVAEEAETSVPVQKDTVQEYQKSHITDEEAEELSQLNDWLTNRPAEDLEMFQRLLKIESGLLIRSMLTDGSTMRDLEEVLGISRSSISRIARKERDATEDVAKRIFFLHFFAK